MNKLTKKIVYLFAVISVLILSCTSFVFAESYSSVNGYIIDNYNVDIKVNENNTFDIIEKIDADFSLAKHGIFRTIPLSNNVKRVDGTENRNRAKVNKVDVNSKFKTTLENGKFKIKIGDPDKTLIGKQNYIIKYNYNIGKDTLKNKDELYYDILGNEWDTTIKNFTFTITLPKEFDKEKLGFSVGTYGTQGTYDLDYKVEGNVIKGRILRPLKQGESVTVRLELPEGYFVGAGHKLGITDFIYFAVPICSLVLAIYLWSKYGKDDEVIEVIEFYPPENLNSLELACLYKGYAETKDIISLLIYLANKGYIKIIEKEKELLNQPFEIIKLKDYDGNNEFERIFLDGLYRNGKEIDGKLVIKDTDLQNSFYKTIQRLAGRTSNYISKKGIFEKTFDKKIISIVAFVLSLITLVAIPTKEYGINELGSIALISFMMALPLFVTTNNISFILSMAFSVVFGFLAVIGSSFSEIIFAESHYTIGFLVGLICVIITGIFIYLMQKRTKYGNELLGKIRGFKTFLETAEKEKLETMVYENPKYFFDILPFTYVLGISNKWIKKFESINVEPPDWYQSNRPFRMNTFNTFMTSTMTNAQNVMASTPSSSGSGGSFTSSGGGFSGGGSGGGGGGSW